MSEKSLKPKINEILLEINLKKKMVGLIIKTHLYSFGAWSETLSKP